MQESAVDGFGRASAHEGAGATKRVARWSAGVADAGKYGRLRSLRPVPAERLRIV